MPYTPVHADWHNKSEAADTQLDAAALEHIESGIVTAAATADMAVPAGGNTTINGVKTFSTPPIVPTPTTSGQAATKAYVDSVAGSGSTPDADATTKGKIQLAGALGGTAASPTVPGLATKVTSTTTATLTVAVSAPGSPAVGDLWLDIS